MADGTKIEWTDATVNAVNGCSVLSPGCKLCYAMKQAHRFDARRGLTRMTAGGMVWTGEVRFNKTQLLKPLAWKRARRIFWNAHGDLFHESVPDEWIDKVFAVCALTPQHSHQILTKRSARMCAYFAERWQGTPARQIDCGSAGIIDVPAGGETGRKHQIELACEELIDDLGLANTDDETLWTEDGSLKLSQWEWPLPNVWLGVSVEDQQRADERIPDLLATPAAVRFISAEPLLGPVDLTKVQAPRYVSEDHDLDWKFSALDTGDYYQFEDSLGVWECGDGPQRDTRLDWVIVGGESGPGARPMHPAWARSLRDQCADAGVPFLFKQWGEHIAHASPGAKWRDGSPVAATLEPVTFERVGKKAAGRLLDGVQHDGMPA